MKLPPQATLSPREKIFDLTNDCAVRPTLYMLATNKRKGNQFDKAARPW